MKTMNGHIARTCGVAAVCLAMALTASCKGKRRSGDTTSAAAGAAAGATTPEGMPSRDELNAFLAGAGDVHLGMSEKEVSKAFGSKPTRREDAPSKGVPVDIVWDKVGGGAQPGGAVGRFEDDRLIRVEFVGANRVLPRIDRASAQTVLTGAYAQRSYARTLRIADIEAAVGSPGYRVTWIIDGRGGPTQIASRWMWEVVPGDNEVLYVEEEGGPGGTAGQPVIRKKG
jgi:hypothetical protein